MKAIELAKTQLGIKEILGKTDNPEILKYFKIMGVSESVLKDETAWCSAFVNWIAISCGLPHSGKLDARSWLHVGTPTAHPKEGDVVVLWRESPNSWKGHVGFFIKATKDHIYILGGNQDNQVCIKPYPKSRLLSYQKL